MSGDGLSVIYLVQMILALQFFLLEVVATVVLLLQMLKWVLSQDF